jgi:Glycosyltransferase family 87
MFKLSSKNASTATEKPESILKVPDKRVWKYLLDAGIVLAMSVLLMHAIWFQVFKPKTDAGKYQCYALIFWKGMHGIDALPSEQCAFLHEFSPNTIIESMKSRGIPASLISLAESQSTSGPFHNLPKEYPLLSIVPFSLGLIAPLAWYQVAFGIWMLVLAAIIYFVIKQTRSTSAAITFAIYLVLGGWALAASRFDLIPAALTLGAVILAGRAKWKWAFSLLALATLLKFYPAVLVAPFLIAQQMQSSDKWYSWRRWSALGVFFGICAVVMLISLVLSITDTYGPLEYFLHRPMQIESTPATLLWLGSFFGYPLTFIHTYESVNVFSSLSHPVYLFSLLCLGGGLLYTFWLQLRGKLDVYTASLLTVLIIMIMGKVFSPQYLLWVIPLLAFIGKANWKWLSTWGIAGLLTTWIWPYIYSDSPLLQVPLQPIFYPVVLARNIIILGFVIALLYQATRRRFVLAL